MQGVNRPTFGRSCLLVRGDNQELGEIEMLQRRPRSANGGSPARGMGRALRWRRRFRSWNKTTKMQPPIENSGAQSFGNLVKPDRLDTIIIDSEAANRLAA